MGIVMEDTVWDVWRCGMFGNLKVLVLGVDGIWYKGFDI